MINYIKFITNYCMGKNTLCGNHAMLLKRKCDTNLRTLAACVPSKSIRARAGKTVCPFFTRSSVFTRLTSTILDCQGYVKETEIRLRRKSGKQVHLTPNSFNHKNVTMSERICICTDIIVV